MTRGRADLATSRGPFLANRRGPFLAKGRGAFLATSGAFRSSRQLVTSNGPKRNRGFSKKESLRRMLINLLVKYGLLDVRGARYIEVCDVDAGWCTCTRKVIVRNLDFRVAGYRPVVPRRYTRRRPGTPLQRWKRLMLPSSLSLSSPSRVSRK